MFNAELFTFSPTKFCLDYLNTCTGSVNFCFVVCHLCQHCLERYYHIYSSKQQFSNEKQSKKNVQNYKHFSHFCTFLFLFLSTSYFKSYKHIKNLSFLQGSKSPSPTRASSKSPKRAGSGKMSDSRPQSAKSKSPSPSRKSSAKSRSSSGKRGSSSHERKKSKSPSPSRKGTISASSRGRSAGKKKVRVKSPSRTQSGLKIRDLSDQGLTAVPPNLVAGKITCALVQSCLINIHVFSFRIL